MENLVTAIRAVIPGVVKEWNTVKLPLFEQLVGQSFEQYFQGRQTQEKTKMVAPILDSIFALRLKHILPEWMVAEGKGLDYMFGEIPFECKITFGSGDSWTGNGYSKTPWHLLMRFELDQQGNIIKQFAAIVDLSACGSKWSATGDTSNFSTLKFQLADQPHLIPICGKFSNITRTGRPATYIMPIMETV